MGITQTEFSKNINCSQSTVSLFEKGKAKLSDEQLRSARELLGILNVPLLDEDDGIYEAQLQKWKELSNDGRVEEARKMRGELAPITKMPFKKDLLMTFHLFDSKLLFEERNFTEAQKLLELLQPSIKDTTIENKYHFHFGMGVLNFFKGNYSLALKHYLISHDLLGDKDIPHTLCFNIALCYSRLGMYISVIAMLERIHHLYRDDESSMFGMRMDSILGVNYMQIGRVGFARRLFDSCLKRARINSNEAFIAFSLHNHGCACLNVKEYDKALEHFGEAYLHTKEGQKAHYENLYYEVLCLIAMRNLSKARARLSYAKSVSATMEDKHYTALYDSLEHLFTIRENTSIEYIEQTTITYLIEKREYFRALEYCEVLSDIFIKKNSKMKAIEIKEIAHNLRIKIMRGDDEG